MDAKEEVKRGAMLRAASGFRSLASAARLAGDAMKKFAMAWEVLAGEGSEDLPLFTPPTEPATPGVLKFETPAGGLWKEQEEVALKDRHVKGWEPDAIAAALGRSLEETADRLEFLGLVENVSAVAEDREPAGQDQDPRRNNGKRWSEGDDVVLKSLAEDGQSDAVIGGTLGRSEVAIAARRSKLELVPYKSSPWTSTDDEKVLRLHRDGVSTFGIVGAMGQSEGESARTASAIRHRLKKLLEKGGS